MVLGLEIVVAFQQGSGRGSPPWEEIDLCTGDDVYKHGDKGFSDI